METSRRSFLEINDLDTLVLLELSYEEIQSLVINKHIQAILNNNFWCLWLNKKHINANKNCKHIAKHMTPDMNVNYLTALQNDDVIMIKMLYDNHLYEPNEPVCMGYEEYEYDEEPTNECVYEDPLMIAIDNDHVALTQYLLTFPIDQDVLDSALFSIINQYHSNYKFVQVLVDAGAIPTSPGYDTAVYKNNVESVRILLKNFKIKKSKLKKLLKIAFDNKYKDMVNVLLQSSSNI